MDPSLVHAIPNAIDVSKFIPSFSRPGEDHAVDGERRRPPTDRIQIVVISRLVYRKGVDLLVGIIPKICAKFPHVDFLVGGDGAKKLVLEEMVERERLQERVTFLGSVPHAQVRHVLARGHIFLNCSLTESFCIAILEAAACGLFVVSTNVGGVPEVLPQDMILMSEPSVTALVEKLELAIRNKIIVTIEKNKDGTCRREKIDLAFDPLDFHNRIGKMYSWNRVAIKTIQVYEHVLRKPRLTLLERLNRYKSVGPVAGYVACLIAISLHFFSIFVDYWQPRSLIDVVPDLPLESSKRAKNEHMSNEIKVT